MENPQLRVPPRYLKSRAQQLDLFRNNLKVSCTGQTLSGAIRFLTGTAKDFCH